MSDDTTTLEDIFKRDEKGRFAPKEEAPAAELPPVEVKVEAPAPQPDVKPAATVPPPSPTGETPPNTGEVKPGPSPVPANVESDEVKGLKAELARLRSQRREAPATVSPPPKPPSVFEDEEGYTNHLNATIAQQVFAAKLELSEENARERFPDLAQIMGTVEDEQGVAHVNWINAVRKNPALAQQFERAADPVRFAYQTLKKLKALEEIGDDPNAYRERLRAEIAAELAAKAQQPVATPAGQPAKPAPVIPQTLAGTASKASREAPEFNGPKPLEDIIGSAPHNRQR